MRHSDRGFTLIEVLVAIVVLGVGILALAGTSALATRMIGRGKVEAGASVAGSRRLEMLRLAAYGSTPSCTGSQFASGDAPGNGLTESWVVPAAGGLRMVRVTLVYRTVSGSRVATLETALEC